MISEQIAALNGWFYDREGMCLLRGTFLIFQYNSSSTQPLSAEVRIQSWTIPRIIWPSKWHWGRFSSKYFGFPLSVTFCAYLHLPAARTRLKINRRLRTFEKKIFIYICRSGFGGLEVACWPLVPKFAGSNSAEAVGFFG
jgi:hypothetical protein